MGLCAVSGSASWASVCKVDDSFEEISGFEVEYEVVLILMGRNSGRIVGIAQVERGNGLRCARDRTRDCMRGDKQPMSLQSDFGRRGYRGC